jgi:hypothetical protein
VLVARQDAGFRDPRDVLVSFAAADHELGNFHFFRGYTTAA